MGTRADFYVGRGENAEWIASIAWDGDPQGIGDVLLKAESESQYRDLVAKFIATRKDATVPEQGWPWPWSDSRTSDYAYAFDGGKVLASCFGSCWFDPLQPKPEESGDNRAIFPNMENVQKVAFGKRSGGTTLAGSPAGLCWRSLPRYW